MIEQLRAPLADFQKEISKQFVPLRAELNILADIHEQKLEDKKNATTWMHNKLNRKREGIKGEIKRIETTHEATSKQMDIYHSVNQHIHRTLRGLERLEAGLQERSLQNNSPNQLRRLKLLFENQTITKDQYESELSQLYSSLNQEVENKIQEMASRVPKIPATKLENLKGNLVFFKSTKVDPKRKALNSIDEAYQFTKENQYLISQLRGQGISDPQLDALEEQLRGSHERLVKMKVDLEIYSADPDKTHDLGIDIYNANVEVCEALESIAQVHQIDIETIDAKRDPSYKM